MTGETALTGEGDAPADDVIRSRWLGEIEFDPGSELFFPAGIPGFENEHRILPVEIPSQRPLVYLQSVANPEICFAALPAFVVDCGFQLHLSEDELVALGFPEQYEPGIGTDVLCLVLLIPSGEAVQANLNAPIVINLHNSRAVQCLCARNTAAHYRLGKDGEWER
jgi:flagellar assembly factor FliW